MKKKSLTLFLLIIFSLSCAGMKGHFEENIMSHQIKKSEKEWKEILGPEEYRVLRKSGTESPFSGEYNDHWEQGIYVCAACGNPLFSSETKYDHGTGWPSFTSSTGEDNIQYRKDDSHGMIRTEVRCALCESHLGHVFNDGPEPTHKHYCINSVALDFISTESAYFAAGCFWGIEHKFKQVPGVVFTQVGYSGGHKNNPSYKQVCSGDTGHAETVKVIFNPSDVTYEELLDKFFSFHDPTQSNKQSPNIGTQYRSVIFYENKDQKKAAEKKRARLEKSDQFPKHIVTEIQPFKEFYKAEEYHQNYIEKQNKRYK